jgi:hypothetical protein
MAWSEDEVRGLEAIEVEYTDKDGENTTWAGAPLTTVLDLSGVTADAAILTFVASDGNAADVTLDEVQDCAECVVAFQDCGGFRMVLPDFSSKVQAKDVVEIQV